MSQIVNVLYHSQAVTQYKGNCIVGYHSVGAGDQLWEIVNVGDNRITIQNVVGKLYASAVSECKGLGTSPDRYVWTQLPVPSGNPAGPYQIATEDGKYIWRLTGGNNYDPIVLEATPYQGPDAQWGYYPNLRTE